MKKKIAAATCMAVLCLGGSSALASIQKPVSYLSLDSKPSIELGLNASGKVIKVEVSNKEGKKVLSGVKITGLSVKNAVNTIVSSSVRNNYITKDGSTVVAITSETNNKTTADKIKCEANAGAAEALKKNKKKAVIQNESVSLSLHDEAKKYGITPGKLNLIKKLQALDSTATIQKYKDESVKNIMYAIKVKKAKGNVANKAKTPVSSTTTTTTTK
ncbi:anti-sigma-I factor RsgI family protein [Clostridium cylindrosporum]|uniref:Anti-sigma factor RsgI-like middle domain-containing protein n=1 Tax=Clostridium cylindrosporum DSM 605 TaxID=1121307 RepID=A0A0J8D7F6_CLOCY|nr:hypothetical protein [Clostridium cylindrosporum]KMT21990.1 hypothetical protein CLCY_3c02610 [Clostridium cylindrosporum DSM 605]